METQPNAWIDDVAVFWTPSVKPVLTATLRFRQGMVDETLPTAGWTHLTGRLARRALPADGPFATDWTALLESGIDLQGSPAAVGAALESITGWLAHPDFTWLADESRQLQAENQHNSRSGINLALGSRYGASGPGLILLGKLGLHNATLLGATPGNAPGERFEDWIRTRFTAGNAVLVLDGPPPPGLRLALPPGDVRLTPRAVPLPLSYPAGYPGQSADLVSTAVLPRSTTTDAIAAMARLLMDSEFPVTPGRTGDRGMFSRPIDAEDSLVGCYCRIDPEPDPTVLQRWFTVLQRLRTGRYERRLIAGWVQRAQQSLTDSERAVSRMVGQASRYLSRGPGVTDAQWLDDLDHVDQARIADLAEGWLASELLALPDQITWPDQLPLLGRPNWYGHSGTSYQGLPLNSDSPNAASRHLLINDQGLQLTIGSVRTGQAFTDTVGMLCYENGARVLIGREGYSTPIEPDRWIDGDKAIALLDELIPPELRIPQP